MNISLLGDVILFYLCIGLIALWLVCRALFGVDILEPCFADNVCTIQAVTKYEEQQGRSPVSCKVLSKVDNRKC